MVSILFFFWPPENRCDRSGEFPQKKLPQLTPCRMNRRKGDFKFAYKYLEDELQ